MDFSITCHDYLLHHSHTAANLRPFLVICGLNIVLFTLQHNNNDQIGFPITESIYKDISLMFLSHVVAEICQILVFHIFWAAILDLCKLNHVPPFIFSYTFFLLFSIYVRNK
jgi:hypothetical protein